MILTIAHTKGGVGKSTLVWHLAHAMKEIGKSVKIIDLDFQQTLFFVNVIGKERISVSTSSSITSLISRIADNSDKFDVILIDVGGFDSRLNRKAIEIADTVLVPIGDSVTEVLGLKTFEPILNDAAKNTRAVAVLNGIHPSARNFGELRTAIGPRFEQLSTVVRQRSVYRQTMKRGKSVFDLKSAVKAQEEIRGVRDDLLRS